MNCSIVKVPREISKNKKETSGFIKDAGVDVSPIVTMDRDGISRPQNSIFDMGA